MATFAKLEEWDYGRTKMSNDASELSPKLISYT